MSDSDSSVDKEQGFVSHLIELRDRLLKMLLAVGILFLCLFWFSDKIYTALAAPLLRHLPDSQMIAIDVAAPFFIPFKLTLMLCVFLAVPYLLYQIWAFIAPGLYSHEKKLVVPLLVSSTVLFYMGVAFAYFVVFPLVFGFFTSVAPEGVTVSTDIGRYLDFVITLFFAFGIAFEVPVATVLVVAVGITTPEQLVKIRPYVFVAAFIIGMFLTPPDLISQTLLAIPMWLLYEVGIVFARKYQQRITDAGLAWDKRHDNGEDDGPDGDGSGGNGSGTSGGSGGGATGGAVSGMTSSTTSGAKTEGASVVSASVAGGAAGAATTAETRAETRAETGQSGRAPNIGLTKGAPRSDKHTPEYEPPRPAGNKSVAVTEDDVAASDDEAVDGDGKAAAEKPGHVKPALIQTPDASGSYRNSLTDHVDDDRSEKSSDD